MARSTCAKVFECAPDAGAVQFADVDACTRKFQDSSGCASLTSERICNGGTWNAKNAQRCVDEVRNLTCDEAANFRGPTCTSPCAP